MSASYYVHRTMTGKEFDAAIGLREYGYACYVPWVESVSRRRAEQLAYFRGYIFVRNHIVWQKHREVVVDKRGRQLVIGAVAIGGDAIPIPEHLVARIAFEAARERIGDDAEPMAPRFKPGDIGIIRSGPFEGHEVAIEAISGEAARVALSIFNNVHSISTPVDNLEAAA